MKTSQQGKDLIKKFEGFRQYAYPDPASPLYRATSSWKLPWGKAPASKILRDLPDDRAAKVRDLSGAPWTIGYGFTKNVRADMFMTQAEANARLDSEISSYETSVSRALKVPASQKQFDAMVSLAWNIGATKAATSSVMKAHNRGDTASAARAFHLWNKANGKELHALVLRRAEESQLYLSGVAALPVPEVPAEGAEAPTEVAHESEMPQTVDGESSLSSSPINRASVVAGGTAAVSAAADAINSINGVKYGLESLGSWVVPTLLVAVVVLCGYIIYTRYQQRKGGWA